MRRLHVIGLLFLLWISPVPADLPVPPQVLDPQTVAESWNVIQQATANVQRLLTEGRIEEIPQQISLCSPSLRFLARSGGNPDSRAMVDAQTAAAFRLINDIAQSGLARLPQSVESSFKRLKDVLAELQTAFPEGDVHALIRFCPTHPQAISPRADISCPFCGVPLRIRGIPYTDLQATPETPRIKFSLAKGAPGAVTSGRAVDLEAVLADTSGRPVPPASLALLHAAPVRFLLVDQTLTDFHLLTPGAPGDAAAALTASFVPRLAGPYRLWVEAALHETGIPEYPHADLGGEFKVVDRARQDFLEVVSTTVGGFRFDLTFTGGNGGSPPLGQVSLMRIHVSDASGQPVTRLEPLMQAFAHLTGFYDDGNTVLRLHPLGGDILREDLRGGPWLAFKIRPPQTGFIRFFCQVRIDGHDLTVPLGINIVR